MIVAAAHYCGAQACQCTLLCAVCNLRCPAVLLVLLQEDPLPPGDPLTLEYSAFVAEAAAAFHAAIPGSQVSHSALVAVAGSSEGLLGGAPFSLPSGRHCAPLGVLSSAGLDTATAP